MYFVSLPKLPSALETSQLFTDHIFMLHRISGDIALNWGPQFNPSLTNGQTKRTKQELEATLTVCSNQTHQLRACTWPVPNTSNIWWPSLRLDYSCLRLYWSIIFSRPTKWVLCSFCPASPLTLPPRWTCIKLWSRTSLRSLDLGPHLHSRSESYFQNYPIEDQIPQNVSQLH